MTFNSSLQGMSARTSSMVHWRFVNWLALDALVLRKKGLANPMARAS
jgi:hypothetical protein